VSFDIKAKASASVEKLRTRRGALTADQEQRVQRLIGEGMAEEWARREILAYEHPLACECEVCI
jgi:hypothetical protein